MSVAIEPYARAKKPSTSADPIVRQLFDEQDRLGWTNQYLSSISGIHAERIAKMRHPNNSHGKRIMIHHVSAIASALGFKWPTKLERRI